MRAGHHGRIALATLAALYLWPGSARMAAQAPRSTSLTAAAGVGLRSAGSTADCCGPFVTDLERPRSLWLGGSVSRVIGHRLAVDAELTWAREPRYTAYVQGVFGSAPVRGYSADNQISTITTAGLIRWHGWQGLASRVDLVGGAGWAHERRVSHLRSVVFRPGPYPEPDYAFDITDGRNTAAAIVGVDAETSGPFFSVVGQFRVLMHWSGDPARTDLDLGRQVVRFGAGVRARF